MKRKTAIAMILALLLLGAAGCSDSTAADDGSGADDVLEEMELTQESAVTFSDGATADLYRWDGMESNVYLLADGTQLLTVNDLTGPQVEAADGLTVGLTDLDEQVQTAITAYFEQQGAIYDESEELTKAYEEYLRCQESGETYEVRTIVQEISETFANQKIICFKTSVLLPEEGEVAYSAVFDTETGEAVSQWELFTASESEVREWLAGYAADDEASAEEIAAALEPEYIFLYPDYLEIMLPAGTLANKETAYGSTIEYDDTVLAQLAESARPET